MESVRFTNRTLVDLDDKGNTIPLSMHFEEHSRDGHYILDMRGAGVPNVDVRTYSGIEQDGANLYNVLYKPRDLTFNLGFETDDRTGLYEKKQMLYSVIGANEQDEIIDITIYGEDGNYYYCSGVLERGAEGYTRDRTGNIEKTKVQFKILDPFLSSEPPGNPNQDSIALQSSTGLTFPLMFPLQFTSPDASTGSRGETTQELAIDYMGNAPSKVALDIYGYFGSSSTTDPLISIANETTGGRIIFKNDEEIPPDSVFRLYYEGVQARVGFFTEVPDFTSYTNKFTPHIGLPNAWRRVDLTESRIDGLYLVAGINNLVLTLYRDTRTSQDSHIDVTYHTRWLGI